MTVLNVVITGSGVIARTHAGAILRHPGLRLSALADPDPQANDRLAGWIGEQGGPPPARYASLGEALAAEAADLVVVCTPSGTHADLAEEALAAGVHVLVEKPLDASLPAARRIARVATDAEAAGLVCAVVCQHRFDPASVAVAARVRAGDLGRLTSAVASVPWWRGQRYYDSAGWRGTWEQDGGGATINQGVHTVDLLLWLFGRPEEVFAYTGVLAHERVEVEDVAVAAIRFADGALAVLHATTAAYPGIGVRLQVHGSQGSAVIHDDQLEYLHTADGPDPSAYADGPDRSGDAVPPSQLRGATKPDDAFVTGHLRQYHDTVEAILGGRRPGVTAVEALLDVAVVKAVYLSAHLRRPVSVPAVLAGDFDDVLAAVEGSAATVSSVLRAGVAR
ncbi:gfo/Idh/MocA family oxidoreductase [Micromonospora acroterricola]|uniref:Gfo/Idh/MocA family oxidoreductase n=1 Tax=Micromonospora acroterricola TaxID=2202421 RepID=A0A317CU31_9ACTN|nr:Gfo/Idh/MocA family oxidoreductase [Micromonospora acroterricola]PWR05006.1 gfo/Idh/MocA family oxidoreductase [Micromonospora acroterricola]